MRYRSVSVTTASQCLVGKCERELLESTPSEGLFLPCWFGTDVTTTSSGLTAFSSSPVSTIESELDPSLWLRSHIDCPSRSKRINWLSRKQEACFDWRGIIQQNGRRFDIDGGSNLGLEVKRLKPETLIFLAPDWHLRRFTRRKWGIVIERDQLIWGENYTIDFHYCSLPLVKANSSLRI